MTFCTWYLKEDGRFPTYVLGVWAADFHAEMNPRLHSVELAMLRGIGRQVAYPADELGNHKFDIPGMNCLTSTQQELFRASYWLLCSHLSSQPPLRPGSNFSMHSFSTGRMVLLEAFPWESLPPWGEPKASF
eukprot:6161895-Amphidinium_carterae.2